MRRLLTSLSLFVVYLLFGISLGTLTAQQPPATPGVPIVVCPNGQAQCVRVITETPVPTNTPTLLQVTRNPLSTPTHTPTVTSTPLPTITPTPTVTPPLTTTVTATLTPPDATPTGEAGSVLGSADSANNPREVNTLAHVPDIGVQVYYIQSAVKALWDAFPAAFVRIDVVCPISSEVKEILANLGTRYALISIDRGGAAYNSPAYVTCFMSIVHQLVAMGYAGFLTEVGNEADYNNGGAPIPPDVYSAGFHSVVSAVRSDPDPRVNQLVVMGAALGSGDPIDGTYPTGFANMTSNRAHWQEFIPKIQDVTTVFSWHDYGEEGDPTNGVKPWGTNGLYSLDNTYEVIPRVRHFLPAGSQVCISEMNRDAGQNVPTASLIKNQNFLNALWHVSMFVNYTAAGNVRCVVNFDWQGQKGMLAGGGTPLPVYFATQSYIRTVQAHVLAVRSGLDNRWADAIVTTDDTGKKLGIVSVNKADTPQTIDLSFDIPATITGNVTVTRTLMQSSGGGQYGTAAAVPTSTVSTFTVSLIDGKQLRYHETIPADSLVFYTVIMP